MEYYSFLYNKHVPLYGVLFYDNIDDDLYFEDFNQTYKIFYLLYANYADNLILNENHKHLVLEGQIHLLQNTTMQIAFVLFGLNIWRLFVVAVFVEAYTPKTYSYLYNNLYFSLNHLLGNLKVLAIFLKIYET